MGAFLGGWAWHGSSARLYACTMVADGGEGATGSRRAQGAVAGEAGAAAMGCNHALPGPVIAGGSRLVGGRVLLHSLRVRERTCGGHRKPRGGLSSGSVATTADGRRQPARRPLRVTEGAESGSPRSQTPDPFGAEPQQPQGRAPGPCLPGAPCAAAWLARSGGRRRRWQLRSPLKTDAL